MVKLFQRNKKKSAPAEATGTVRKTRKKKKGGFFGRLLLILILLMLLVCTQHAVK